MPQRARSKRLSPKKRTQIIAALKANPHARQVARRIRGVTYAIVWRVAKAEGIDLSAGRAARGSRWLSAERRAEIVAALRTNPNASQIARQVGGVSEQTVRTIGLAEGIDFGAAARKRAARLAKKGVAIVAALRVNPNGSQVARQIRGVSYITIKKIAKAEGIRLEGKSWRGSARRSTSGR
jgi:DNA-binding transcriptional ArsR family regulator